MTSTSATVARPVCTIHPVSVPGVSALAGMLPLSTQGACIVDPLGNTYQITGTAVGGFQTVLQLDGSWNYPWRTLTVNGTVAIGLIDRLAAAGFNCIRLLICEDVCYAGVKPLAYVNPVYNPDWFANPNDLTTVLDAVAILDKVIAYCGRLGLRVILDMHALAPNGNNAVATHGLWYTTATPTTASSPVTHTAADTRNEADWITAWCALAARYLGNSIVIGADLVNEPWAATWGDGNPATDICAAYARCGNAIHAVNPDWLIFCEGIYDTINFGAANGGWVGVGWAAGLDCAGTYPVLLTQPGKLVYSPHEYGPGVNSWNYFFAPTYPANMTAVWNQMYGYLTKQNIAPLYLGEIGDMLVLGANNGFENADRYARAQQWLQQLMAYTSGQTSTGGTPDVPAGCPGISWSWFCWSTNGYSGSPGSIGNTDLLMNDFNTVDQTVLQAITPFLAPPLLANIPVSLSVTLDGPAPGPITMQWATSDGNAIAGTHYVAAQGTLTFAAGQSSASITVYVRPIAAVGRHAFNVVLSAPQGCTFGARFGNVSITYA